MHDDDGPFEEDLVDPDPIEEVPVEELSGEDYIVEDYTDGAYATDDLMADGWADPLETSVPEPEVDWRSAENTDWDI